jgi:2-polyprenyl-6-methoxyphenol hydroxylase-like FAD-dependent oxidoreductase
MSRAVVIGGSVAGMCAARVLSDFFDDVVLLDRDHYPSDIAARAGVPQSRHAHALLARGQRELDVLFPGFTGAMLQGGALMFDAGDGFATRRKLGWQDIGSGGLDTLWASRELLEFTVRSLLRAQTKIELRQGVQVIGLTRGAGGNAVSGVRMRVAEQGEQELAADLVVDATGRHSHVDDWLRALGATPPRKQVVDSHVGYASRLYKAPVGADRPPEWWWKGLWVESEAPTMSRGGVLFPIEGDRWLITVGGIEPEYPPTDEQGFVAFLDTLSSRCIARAVRHAEPLSGVSGNRSMANVFRHYEEQRQALRGFIALGDSVCAFNPIYGQGMSSAAACASILRDLLRERGRGPSFEREFWQRQAKFVKGIWDIATGADFAWPGTDGERPKTPKLISEYLRIAMRSAHEDAELRRHLIPIFNLVAPPSLFFEPRFMAKVLLHTAKKELEQRLLGSLPIPDAPPR